MESNWNTIPKKTDKQSNNYHLYDFLNEGGCLRCVKGNCRNPPSHSLSFSPEFAYYVKYPTKIDGFLKAISCSKLDFTKAPFYTICDYVNGRCRNCEEGRIKYISYNKQKIPICYPDPNFDKSHNKITIGLHIYVEVIKKGSRFEGRIFPVEINYSKNTKMELTQDKPVSFDTDPIGSHFEATKESRNETYATHVDPVKESYLEHADSTKELHVEACNETYATHADPVKESHIDFSKIIKTVIIENNIQEIKLKDENPLIVSISRNALLNLKIENDLLKDENTKQQIKIKSLEQELYNLKYLNSDLKLLEEALYNVKRLSNRVSNDFMKSEYSVFSY